jgi:hypothetical protein
MARYTTFRYLRIIEDRDIIEMQHEWTLKLTTSALAKRYYTS